MKTYCFIFIICYNISITNYKNIARNLSMDKKVLVIGSLNIDLVVKVDRFHQEGETILGKELLTLIGGKGANQASAAALQDIPTTLWGYVGEDSFSSHIMDTIKKDTAIDLFVKNTPNSTGTALIETDLTGKNRIVVIAGANGDFTVDKAKENIDIINNYDIIVLQFEIPMPTITYLIQESARRQKTVIVNPAPALFIPDDILEKIDYLTPNEHELAILTNMPTDTMDEIKKAAKVLLGKGVKNIIVTLGDKGAYGLNEIEEHEVPCRESLVVDTTGAGDAYTGGFAAALAQNYPFYDAMLYANKGASISVTKLGAFNSAGSREEINNL